MKECPAHSLFCAVCDLPMEIAKDYTFSATGRKPGTSAIAVMRKVRCPGGHQYDQLVEFIDEEE